VRARRFDTNPIIRPEMLPGRDGENINGPSLIRVPDWIESPLARYHLYFAHHSGTYIRLALADDLGGPWRVHPPGVLGVDDVRAAKGHIASPDVHVDEDLRTIRMYFHAPARRRRGQRSFVAESSDGLAFKPSRKDLGSFYFRAFRWREHWYALAKGGELYRSRDGLRGFERGHNPLADGSIRHVALQLVGDRLWVYYTRIGDAPERILRTPIELTGDWLGWRAAEPPTEVLRPEMPYEGAEHPVDPSRSGAASEAENAVRDPAVFAEDGRSYLLYSVAGERGLAIAELTEERPR